LRSRLPLVVFARAAIQVSYVIKVQ
jgi:hypothetical protein